MAKTKAALQSFSTQELQVKDDFYYELNQHTKNLFIDNRDIARECNGVVLGRSGNGMPFIEKRL